MDNFRLDDETTSIDSYLKAIAYWSHLQATHQDVAEIFPDMPKSQLELLQTSPLDPLCIEYILGYSKKVTMKKEEEQR